MAEVSHSTEVESSQANPSLLAVDKSTGEASPVYEVGFYLIPTIGEEGIGAALEQIRGALAKGNAEIIKEEYPAKKILSYTIERATQGKREKYTESFFGFIKFATSKEAVEQFTKDLRAMNEVLRYLVIETVREEQLVPRRAIFSSDRLEGETIKKPVGAAEPVGEVSEEELNKSIDALVS